MSRTRPGSADLLGPTAANLKQNQIQNVRSAENNIAEEYNSSGEWLIGTTIKTQSSIASKDLNAIYGLKNVDRKAQSTQESGQLGKRAYQSSKSGLLQSPRSSAVKQFLPEISKTQVGYNLDTQTWDHKSDDPNASTWMHRYKAAKYELIALKNRSKDDIQRQSETIVALKTCLDQLRQENKSSQHDARDLEKSLDEFRRDSQAQIKTLTKARSRESKKLHQLSQQYTDVSQQLTETTETLGMQLQTVTQERQGLVHALTQISQQVLGGINADHHHAIQDGLEPLPRTTAQWAQLKYTVDQQGQLQTLCPESGAGQRQRAFNGDGGRAVSTLVQYIGRLHQIIHQYSIDQNELFQTQTSNEKAVESVRVEYLDVHNILDDLEKRVRKLDRHNYVKKTLAQSSQNDTVSERVKKLDMYFQAVFFELSETKEDIAQAKSRVAELKFYELLHSKIVNNAKKRYLGQQEERKQAATTIQRYYKGHRLRKELSNKEDAAVTIQRHYKGYYSRRQYNTSRRMQEEALARGCHRALLSFNSRKQTFELLAPCVRRNAAVQTAEWSDDPEAVFNIAKVRAQRGQGLAGDMVYMTEKEAATKVQALYRGHSARKEYRHKVEQNRAAKKIQANYKGHQGRKQAQAKKEEKAAVKIQSKSRQHLAKKKVNNIRTQQEIDAEIKRLDQAWSARDWRPVMVDLAAKKDGTVQMNMNVFKQYGPVYLSMQSTETGHVSLVFDMQPDQPPKPVAVRVSLIAGPQGATDAETLTPTAQSSAVGDVSTHPQPSEQVVPGSTHVQGSESAAPDSLQSELAIQHVYADIDGHALVHVHDGHGGGVFGVNLPPTRPSISPETNSSDAMNSIMENLQHVMGRDTLSTTSSRSTVAINAIVNSIADAIETTSDTPAPSGDWDSSTYVESERVAAAIDGLIAEITDALSCRSARLSHTDSTDQSLRDVLGTLLDDSSDVSIPISKPLVNGLNHDPDADAAVQAVLRFQRYIPEEGAGQWSQQQPRVQFGAGAETGGQEGGGLAGAELARPPGYPAWQVGHEKLGAGDIAGVPMRPQRKKTRTKMRQTAPGGGQALQFEGGGGGGGGEQALMEGGQQVDPFTQILVLEHEQDERDTESGADSALESMLGKLSDVSIGEGGGGGVV